jgi:hypothetical protein
MNFWVISSWNWILRNLPYQISSSSQLQELIFDCLGILMLYDYFGLSECYVGILVFII